MLGKLRNIYPQVLVFTVLLTLDLISYISYLFNQGQDMWYINSGGQDNQSQIQGDLEGACPLPLSTKQGTYPDYIIYP